MMDDHQVILKVVAAMKRYADALDGGEPVDGAFLRGTATFMRVFADQCHHGKEEAILFPKLAELGVPVEGGPIGVMRIEHELGRKAVAKLFEMADDCDAGNPPGKADVAAHLRELAAFYEQHIWKEDNVLFPMGDRLLSTEVDAELMRRYDEAEESHGHGVHCEQAAFAEACEGRFGVGG